MLGRADAIQVPWPAADGPKPPRARFLRYCPPIWAHNEVMSPAPLRSAVRPVRHGVQRRSLSVLAAFALLAASSIALPAMTSDPEAIAEGTRALVDLNLVKRRPAGAGRPRPVQYRPVSMAANAGAAGPGQMLVGVTFWRMRTVRPGDDPDTRILLLDEGVEVEQVPERIEAGTPLKPGERVRLSVEVPSTGYLYVLDRESYANGTTGPAHLIYPNFQTRPGENAVAAGRQIEIPHHADRIPSFKLVKSRPDHVGETLIVMVSPQPLSKLETSSRIPPVIDDALVAEWEAKFGFQVDHHELVGGASMPWTAAEKRSSDDPNHRLTQDDALPQSVYAVKAKPGQPILLKLPVKLGGS